MIPKAEPTENQTDEVCGPVTNLNSAFARHPTASREERIIFQVTKTQRLQRLYPEICPTKNVSTKVKSNLHLALHAVDFRQNFIICHQSDLSRWVFTFGLMQLQGRMKVASMNGQRLLRIKFGDLEELSDEDSRPDLNSQILAITLGYAEPQRDLLSLELQHRLELASNKGPLRRQESQLLPLWVGQSLWIYFKGTFTDLHQQYGGLVERAQGLGCQVIGLREAVAKACDPCVTSPHNANTDICPNFIIEEIQ